MAFADQFKAVAAKLMAEFGVNASLVRTTRTLNRADDTMVETTQSTKCKAALVKPRDASVEGGRTEYHSEALLTVLPLIGDQLILGSNTYRIDEVLEVAPTGTAIIYRVKVCQ